MMCGGRGRGQRHVGNVFNEMHNSECGPTVTKYAGVQGCLKSVMCFNLDLLWPGAWETSYQSCKKSSCRKVRF